MKFLRKYLKETITVPHLHREVCAFTVAGRVLRTIHYDNLFGQVCRFWQKNFQIERDSGYVFYTADACYTKYGVHLNILGEHIVFCRKRRTKQFDFRATFQYHREMTRCMYSSHGKKRKMCWLMYDSIIDKARADRIALIISCVLSKTTVARKFAPHMYGDNSDIYHVCNFERRETLPVDGLMPDMHVLERKNFAQKNSGWFVKPTVAPEPVDDIDDAYSDGILEYAASESDEESVASV